MTDLPKLTRRQMRAARVATLSRVVNRLTCNRTLRDMPGWGPREYEPRDAIATALDLPTTNLGLALDDLLRHSARDRMSDAERADFVLARVDYWTETYT